MTEPAHLTAVRESYDTVADNYAQLVKNPSELDPLSRSMLGAFAELVRSAPCGPVADLGCGPGLVTEYLGGLVGLRGRPCSVSTSPRAWPDSPNALSPSGSSRPPP